MARFTDAQIVDAFHREGSAHGVGRALGMNASSAHERLVRLGFVMSPNLWTAQDDLVLLREYRSSVDSGKLEELAAEMGRTKNFVCRKARALGLTNQGGPRFALRVWMSMSAEEKRTLMDEFASSGEGMEEFCKKRGLGAVNFWKTLSSEFPEEWDRTIEKNFPKCAYTSGRAFEYYVQDELSSRGYYVLRSHLSKGPADLVAMGKGSTLAVQCKTNGYLGQSGWNSLVDLADKAGSVPVLAWKGAGGSSKYARITGRKDGSRRHQPMQEFEP